MILTTVTTWLKNIANTQKFNFIVLISLVLLVFGVLREDLGDGYKEEYSYKAYEASGRDRYLSFKSNILHEIKSRLNLTTTAAWQNNYDHQLTMTSSQFEGPQVHIDKLIYNKVEYHRDSVAKNKDPEFDHFKIQSLLFDPDDRYSGKPDLRVSVTMPTPYRENRSAILDKFFSQLHGGDDEITPYKTYTKEVFSIEDSTIRMESIKMDLWLTRFNVTVEAEGFTGRDSDDDTSHPDREINNKRHFPFEIVFKVFPNVSPWYVNNGNAFDKKADMAIGSIFCSKITKWPEETTQIGVTPREVGLNLELIKPEFFTELNPDQLFEMDGADPTVWNKPLYATINFTNIGSFRRGLLQGFDQGYEKITFELLMPLLVRGSWDIRIPPSIVPEYVPAPPYRRDLFDIALPKWGLGWLGKGFSATLYLLMGLFVMYRLFLR